MRSESCNMSYVLRQRLADGLIVFLGAGKNFLDFVVRVGDDVNRDEFADTALRSAWAALTGDGWIEADSARFDVNV